MQSKNQAVNSIHIPIRNPTIYPVLLIVLIMSRITHRLSCLLSLLIWNISLTFYGQDILKDSMTGICRMSLHLDYLKPILFRDGLGQECHRNDAQYPLVSH